MGGTLRPARARRAGAARLGAKAAQLYKKAAGALGRAVRQCRQRAPGWPAHIRAWAHPAASRAAAWRTAAQGGVWLALALAAGAVRLPGGLAPLGMALVMAVPQPAAFLAGAGCALGGFLGMPAAAAARQAAAVLCMAALRLLLGRGSALVAGAAGAAVYAALSQAAALLGESGAGVLHWAPQGLWALGLGLAYRECDADTWLADTPRRAAAALAAAASILTALAILPVPAGWPAGAWMAGALGFFGLLAGALQLDGQRVGLAAAAALAALAARADMGAVLLALAGGWCAGLGGGRRNAAAGIYLAVGLAAPLAAPTLPALGGMAAVHLAAAVAFCLLPQRLLARLEARAATAGAAHAATPAQLLARLAAGLGAVGGGLEQVGRRFAPPPQDPNAPVEAVCAQVCSACTDKARCWGGEYDSTQRAMQHFLQQWRRSCADEFPDYFTCKRRAAVRSALLQAERLRLLRQTDRLESDLLRQAISEQYRALAQGLAGAARTWRPELPAPQTARRVEAMARALHLPLRRVEAVCLPEGPCVRLQLRNARLGPGVAQHLAAAVGRCCGQAMEPACDARQPADVLTFVPRAACRVQAGLAQCALEGGACGDVCELAQDAQGLTLLLCDGMGAGGAAALDARVSALFTAQLLAAGFEVEAAARLVNAALLAAAPGQRGSTLDALRLDGRTGAVRLYKAGGCASYIGRSGQVQRLGARADAAALGLPLGGVGALQAVRLQAVLAPGERLVLVSDGALSHGEESLTRALAALPADLAPEQAARQLLRAALAGAPAQDDATVAVVQLTADAS